MRRRRRPAYTREAGRAALLEALFEQSHIGKVLVDAERRIVRVNQAYAQLLGYAPEALIGRNLNAITHPDDLPIAQNQFGTSADGTLPTAPQRMRCLTREGRAVWVDYTASPIELDGQAFGLGEVVDVTAQVEGGPALAQREMHSHVLAELREQYKRAIEPDELFDIAATQKQIEAALIASEARFRTLFETSRDGIVTVDMEGSIQEANPAYQAMLGYTLDELRVLTYQQLTPPQWHEAEEALVRHVILKQGDSGEYEKEYTRKDGTVFPVSLRTWPVYAEDSQLIGMRAIVRDITERKHAEVALRSSEERFRTIWVAASDAMALSDADGIVLNANPAYCELYGYRPDEVIGQSFAIIFPPEQRDWAVAQYHEIIEARLVLPTYESTIQRADGETRFVEARATLIELGDGHIGMLSIIRDITERKRAEFERERLLEREQELRQQAEQANRLKDEFLATVSHELRTPLTAILGYSQMFQRRPRDEAYIARTVEKIVGSAKAQAQLIEDLLDVSRIVRGQLRIEPQLIDLGAVARAALDTVRPAVEAKGIQLQIDMDPASSMVIGDASRLQQVVWNLLTNATKFTPTAGTISVQLGRDGHNVRLTISDTGQGISAGFLPYVFDRFRQADSTSQRAHSGLGLGLSIVRHLVELHGGNVAAASAGEGLGAAFTIWLPLANAWPASSGLSRPTLEQERKRNPYPSELRGLRVLVVDDQPEILELLHEILVECGAVVRQCQNARAALELLRVWRPDALVSDIAMPGEDGYWLIRQVRALPRSEGQGTPAVALTAYMRVEDRLRVLAAGFQHYVPKPVEPAELWAVLARLERPTAVD